MTVQSALAPYLLSVFSSNIWLSVLGCVLLVALLLIAYILLRARAASLVGKTVLGLEHNGSGNCLVLWEGRRRIPLHPEDKVLAKKVDGQRITAVYRQPGADYQTILLANGRQLAPGDFSRERTLKPSPAKVHLGHSVRRS